MDYIVKGALLLAFLFLASIHWHTYIRKDYRENNGWWTLMAAIAATVAFLLMFLNNQRKED